MDELLIIAIRIPKGRHQEVRKRVERIAKLQGADREPSFATGPVSEYAAEPLRGAIHALGMADVRLIDEGPPESWG